MKKTVTLSIAILLIATVLFSFSLVSADGETTLVVGFDQDFPPYGYIGEDGEFTGFDLELAAAVAEKLGLEIVYQPIAWDAKDMELDSGTIDLIWNGFTINGREDKYEWTEPYKDAGQIILVKADADVEALTDLAGKVVAVQTDSAALQALESEDFAELTASFANLLVVDQYNTAFMDLEASAVDAIAMDVDVAYRKNNTASDSNSATPNCVTQFKPRWKKLSRTAPSLKFLKNGSATTFVPSASARRMLNKKNASL